MQLIKHSLRNTFEVKLNGYSVVVLPRELLKQNRLASHIRHAHANRQNIDLYREAFASLLKPMPPSEWARLIAAAMADLETVND